jgi:hypothetical protein
MINIYGLNERQVEMLDLLWSLDSLDDVLIFLDSLDADQRQECHTLIELIQLSIMDTDTEMMSEYKEAKQVLKQFTLGA